jgi:hypothetical protein
MLSCGSIKLPVSFWVRVIASRLGSVSIAGSDATAGRVVLVGISGVLLAAFSWGFTDPCG